MKWIVFIGIVAAVHSAAVYQRSDIPVKVVYEKPSYLRNLQAREQLSPQQREYVEKKVAAGVRNLEARAQVPEESVDIKTKIVTPNEQVETFNKIQVQENWQGADQNIDSIYEKIQEIILNGANNIKSAADAGHFGERKAEILQSVNKTFEKVLETTKGLIDLKATDEVKQEQNNNIIQQIFSTFTNFTNSVTSTFTNPQGGAQSDEQPQNPLQQIIGNVQSGIQQVFSTFTGGSASTQATVLGDNPTPTPGNNPIQFAQNAIQQLQQNFNNFLQPTQSPNTQGDDATTPGGPFQAIQNVFSQISQAIPNPFAQATTKAPAPAQADGASSPAPNNPLGAITGVIQGFNPGSSGGEGSNNPLQGIQSAGQGILSGITSGGNPAQGFVDQANQLVGGNPLEAGQNVANQIGQAVSNPGQLASQIGNTLSGGGSKSGAEEEITVEKVTAEESKPIEAEKVAVASNDVIEVVKVETPKEEPSPEENKVDEKPAEEAAH